MSLGAKIGIGVAVTAILATIVIIVIKKQHKK